MATEPFNQLENFKSFRTRFVGAHKPNIRTARKKVRSGDWPGVVDGADVYIYVRRWELNIKAPDAEEARALEFLGI